MPTAKNHATLPALLTNHPAELGTKELPMLPTTKPTFRFASLLAFCVLAVLGAGCNGATPGVPADNGRRAFSQWIGERTPGEMRQIYREGIDYLATSTPSNVVYGKLSFTGPQSADIVLNLLSAVPDVAVTDVYIYRNGEARLNDLKGPELKAGFEKEYQALLAELKDSVKTVSEWCAKNPGIACASTSSQRYADALIREQKNGQLSISGLGLHGSAASFKKLWDSSSAIFLINIQDGYYSSMPIYPDTDMKSWR